MYKIVVNITKESVIKFKTCLAPFLTKHDIPRENILLLCLQEDWIVCYKSIGTSYPLQVVSKQSGYIVQMDPGICDIHKFDTPIQNFKHLIQDSYYFLISGDSKCIGFQNGGSLDISTTDDFNSDSRCLFKNMDSNGMYHSWGYYKIISC